MPPRNARGRTKSLTEAREAGVARGARGNRDEDNGDNHQESMMGGGANVLGENVRGAPPAVFGEMEFIQRVFTAIKQVVRKSVGTHLNGGRLCKRCKCRLERQKVGPPRP